MKEIEEKEIEEFEEKEIPQMKRKRYLKMIPFYYRK